MGIRERITKMRDLTAERWMLEHSINLRLFEILKKGAKSPYEISQELRLNTRCVNSLLQSLAAHGYLRCDNNMFRLTEESKKELVADSPDYCGNMINIVHMYDEFRHLDKALLDGSVISADWEKFTPAIERLAQPSIEALIGNMPYLKSEKLSVIDIGCGTAKYSILLAQHNKSAEFVCLDSDKKVIEKAHTNIKACGLENRIRLINSGFEAYCTAERFDIIMLNHFFHLMNYNSALELAMQAHSLAKSKGKIFVSEIYGDSLPSKITRIFDLNMVLHTESGKCYSKKELIRLLGESGFSSIQMIKINADTGNIAYFVGER